MQNPPQTPTRGLEPGINLVTDHTSERRTFTEEEIQAVVTERIDWVRGAARGMEPHFLLSSLLLCFTEAYPGVFIFPVAAKVFLEEAPESFRELVETCNFTGIANSEYVRAKKIEERATRYYLPMDEVDKVATVSSWQRPYAGSAETLRQVLLNYMSNRTGKSRMVDELARKVLCLPMNLAPPLADVHPPRDIPVCQYFSNLFAGEVKDWEPRVQAFICALFITARDRLEEIKQDPDVKNGSATLQSRFRDLMNDGMQFGRHGNFRRTFYQAVCDKAKQLRAMLVQFMKSSVVTSASSNGNSPGHTIVMCATGTDGSPSRETVKTAADALVKSLDLRTEDLAFVVSFDEAHMLTDRIAAPDGHPWSLYAEIRRALRLIRDFPIFTLFLSTVGNLEQFSPLPPLDSSSRLLRTELSPYPPIVFTPLDVLSQRFTMTRIFTLEEVASTYHMAHLGRPLFAAMFDGNPDFHHRVLDLAGSKLLNHKYPTPDSLTAEQLLACIGVRIPIGFNRTFVISIPTERTLVSNHMRLLLFAGIGFAPILTASASEPLLAQAAYQATVLRRWIKGKPDLASSPSTQPVHMLGNHFREDNLDLGNRGELACALVLLDARDCATTLPLAPDESPPGASPAGRSDDGRDEFKFDGASKRCIVTVLQLLEKLIGESYVEMCLASCPTRVRKDEYADIPLKDAFQDAFVYFTHFIKVQSFELVNREYLLLAISRGAAIICADNHHGIDLVIPILFGTELKVENVSAILCQGKNSRHYTVDLNPILFDNMHPYRCGVFDMHVKDPRPVLRMVFALASDKAGVSTPERPQRHSQRQQQERRKKQEEEEEKEGEATRKKPHKKKNKQKKRKTEEEDEKKKKKNNNAGKFTAYDIWFAGAFHETFAVIQRGEEESYKTLLQKIRDSRDVLPVSDEATRRAMRQMQPLTSNHPDHVELWADRTGNVGQQYPLMQEVGQADMDVEAVGGDAMDVDH